ncbi:mitochondrial carrier domain-containing protein [Pelagophyceae sp. CCMP2097]|nr:mitochondrial carrier domain-containing protein [Pelagophyceae sp. CCMP2097]
MSLVQQVAAAGMSAVATVTFIHPIDVVKTRLQVSGGTVGTVISSTMSQEGPTAFYKGIGAAWLREASYTSLRLGLYDPCKELLGAKDKNAHFLKKFAAGCLAGAIGSTVGNPFDVLKTRMMASKTDTSFVGEASALYKSQGVSGFYRGIDANISRAMVLNGTKMACYDEIKQVLVNAGMPAKDIMTQAAAAFSAGFFMTCTVAPFDMIRTKLMNQPPDAKEYTGFVDCAMKIAAKDGPAGFYRGFLPIWARFAPTTTLQLIFFEQFRVMLGMQSL